MSVYLLKWDNLHSSLYIYNTVWLRYNYISFLQGDVEYAAGKVNNVHLRSIDLGGNLKTFSLKE